MDRLRTTIASAVLCFSLLSGCGGTTTGNPLVTIEAAGHSTGLSFFPLIRSAHASVASLVLCFKRVRFKQESSGGAGDSPGSSNADFALGEVSLTSSARKLGTVSIPAGTYRRIEFDFDSACASGKSIQVANDSGSFSTNDSISVRFEGVFTLENADKTLSVNFQALVDQMNTVTSSSEIKDKAEGASGEFRER